MRKLLAGIVIGAVMVGAPAAIAHHGTAHRAVYRQIDGPSWMPERVVIRCEGWSEDSSELRRVIFEGESVNGGRVVYRCVRP